MSHFRYAVLSWEDDPNSNDPLGIQFRGEQGYRRSFFGSPSVGDLRSVGTINFGDGNSQTLYVQITSVDIAEDTFIGSLVDVNGDPIDHTYSAAGNYTAFFQSGARISGLQNSANQGYRTETIVTLGNGNLPPISSLPAIVQVPDDANFSFQIPANDPDGDNISFRLATTQESGIPVFPTGLTVSSSGVIDWSNIATPSFTDVGDLWTVQIIMEDDGGSKVPLDFLLEIVDPTTVNAAPVVTFSPSNSYAPQAGQQLTFTVTADDPDDDDVTSLIPLNAPSGMTFTPDPVTPGDPVSITVDWTPTAAQAGQSFIVQFQATDDRGAQSIPSAVTISPSVVVNQSPIALDDMASTDEDTAIVTIDILVNDSDPDLDPIVITGFDTSATLGLVTDNGDGTFGYDPNSVFESLDDGDTATDSFTYTISDGNGGEATATVDIFIDGVTDVIVDPCTFGTDSADMLLGDDGDNCFDALGGDDTVIGLLGDDEIFGGDGNDSLNGDDTSRGGGTRSPGGDDVIFGDAGNDEVDGRSGNDVLLGGTENDTIFGGDGNDFLIGGAGNDRLRGDVPRVRREDRGSDTFVLAEGDGTDIILDFQDGIDKIGLQGGLVFGDLTISQQRSRTVVRITNTGERLALVNNFDPEDLTSDDFVEGIPDISNVAEAQALI